MILKKWLYQTLEIPQNQQHDRGRDTFGVLRMFLLKTDEYFFSELKQSQIEGESYQQMYDRLVYHFQRYLCKKQLKRLKNGYQVRLRQFKDEKQLLKLALYTGINSNLRTEIVDKIVSFTQQEQRQLMSAIKEIQKECQQIIEIKKIIERIELLQSTNQQLKASFQQKQHGLRQEINKLNEVQQENKSLSSEIQLYAYQKQHAFTQVGSVEMQDFSYSCCKIKDQIFKISNNYEQINAEREKMQQNNIKLKQDLKKYGKTIKQHIDQLDRLKREHMLSNQQFVLRQIPQIINNQTITPLSLGNAWNKVNLRLSINEKQRKMDTARTTCESQQDSSFSMHQKKCSLGLLLQINQLQKEIQEKKEKVEQLRQIQQNEKVKNRKLTKRLQKIHSEHQNYTNQFTLYSVELIVK